MGTTTQPKWELLANIGDCNPVDYGGVFVYRDTTGVYPPECEVLEPIGEGEHREPIEWRVYRFILEKCSWENEVLSDNRFHPELSAWFADELESAARYVGVPSDGLRRYLCSDDSLERAEAYRALYDYHGLDNFDSYPLTFTDRDEVEKRYNLD